jgi:hypothetical protein
VKASEKLICPIGFGGVLSIGANAKPRSIFQWMRRDLEKGHWWSIGLHQQLDAAKELNATLVTVRAKKKTYLNILTNVAPPKPQQVGYSCAQQFTDCCACVCSGMRADSDSGYAVTSETRKAALCDEDLQHPGAI